MKSCIVLKKVSINDITDNEEKRFGFCFKAFDCDYELKYVYLLNLVQLDQVLYFDCLEQLNFLCSLIGKRK